MAAVIVGFLYWTRAVVIPLALAIFFTFVLSPAVAWLRRRGLPRIPAVVATMVVAVACLLAVVSLIGWQAGSLVQELPDHRERISGKLGSIRAWIDGPVQGRFSLLLSDIERSMTGAARGGDTFAVPVAVVSQSTGWLDRIEAVLGPSADALARTALTIVLVAFLLLGKEDMRNRMLRLIGPRRVTVTTKAVDDAGTRISRYLRTQLAINFAFGVVLAVALLLLGVRYAILWGFMAALLRYIPYIGAWVGLIPPLVAGFAMSDSGWLPIAVLAVYAALEFAVVYIVEPRLFGQSLGLSEVAQIVSAAFWAFLWGPIGLILSGPITACLLVLGKNVPQLHFLEILLGDAEPLSRPMSLFQRLAARDKDEAWHIVTEFAAGQSRDSIVDQLVIPAMAIVHDAADRQELSDNDVDWIVAALAEITDDLPPEQALDDAPIEMEPLTLLAMPAGGPCDSFALDLFAQRLNPHDWEVHCLTNETLASELLAAIDDHRPNIVVIATVSGSSVTQIRYLCKRIRSGHREVRIVLGRWGHGPVSAEQRAEFLRVGVDEIASDVAGMTSLLNSSRSVLVDSSRISADDRTKARAVGTASA